MHVRSRAPLAPLTTLQLGGPAARLAEAESEQDVVDVVHGVEASGEPLFVLGGGSNVVIADEGLPGTVLRVALRGLVVRREAERVVVDVAAGEDWDAFVARAVDEGWSGVTCLSAIPGLVGATPIQNVGAYGEEVSETVAQVRAYDRALRRWVEIDAAGSGFAYRTSAFKGSDRWIITSVRFVLGRSHQATARYPELARALSIPLGGSAPAARVREAVVALRRSKGMVRDPADPESVSAGSFFVNPVVDASTLADIARRAGEAPPSFDAGPGRHKVAAAWLVERAGFAKGWSLGPVGVSRKHALALVNRGGASTRQLLAAARAIQRGVSDRLGVTLEPEPVLVGCIWPQG